MNIFKGLNDQQIGAIRHTSSYQEYPEGSVIFSEGDPSKCMYLILEGKVEIFKYAPEGDAALNRLRRGQVFGEIGMLMPSKTRTASARALRPTRLLQISHNPVDILERMECKEAAVTLMQNLICIMGEWIREMNKQKGRPARELLFDIDDYNLDSNAALKVIDESLPKGLFKFFTGNRKVEPGDYLCLEGEDSDGFYFIHSGELEVLKNRPHSSPEVINRIAGPTIAGEVGFFSGEPRSVNLRAMNEVNYTLFSGHDYKKLKKNDSEKALHILHAIAQMTIHLIITIDAGPSAV